MKFPHKIYIWLETPANLKVLEQALREFNGSVSHHLAALEEHPAERFGRKDDEWALVSVEDTQQAFNLGRRFERLMKKGGKRS